ncbi:MAG: hypothetical protein HOL85_12760 [Rhodospirillaceae bacterium]|nr:hypothetical protein [Rhodospirillaceae bacterium]MBT5265699.1 hypothetical protein [Rhodospirillaceae bacterium]MBT6138330.1 hypothetical protein [Rhodospirillaceae bacterium]
MNQTDPKQPVGIDAVEFHKQRRGRNLAIFASVIGLSVLFYLITIVKKL